MLKKILLDHKEFHFSKSDLPTLIHGEEHAGASLFTVSMLADLYTQGSKIVSLTGYEMAIEEFGNQTGMTDFSQFFTKEKTDEFMDFVTKTSDINDYVILVKNIDFFDENIFNTIKNLKNLIISGDVNKCSYKDLLLQQSFTTKIYFSQLDEPLVGVEEYQGVFVSEKQKGIIEVEV